MNLLSIDDLTREQIDRIFEIAGNLNSGRSTLQLKEGSVLALLFQKASTRTRVSFEVAMAQLGGFPIYIDERTSQMSRGESIADTAKVLSSYVNFIAARMYKHSDLLELADNSSVPVINALTDLEHPCQALSDIYTIIESKKRIKGMIVACIGDIQNNTFNSLMLAATKLGAGVKLIGPKGYKPNPLYLSKAREYNAVDVFNSFDDVMDDVDVIYTDTFVSMGQEGEAEQRRKLFAQYRLTDKVVDLAKPDAVVMHPLPAHRGEEITAEVIDGPKSIVWQQAKNKLLLEKAIILYLSEQNE